MTNFNTLMSTLLLILCFVFLAGSLYFLYRIKKENANFALRNFALAVVFLIISGLCVRFSIESDENSNDYNSYYENSNSRGSNPSFKGRHCTYTVGCDCPGFEPITDGDVWEQSICKHCKHPKKYHK